MSRLDQRLRSRKGQRDRRKDKWDGKLADFPMEKLRFMVGQCRQKRAYATYAEVLAAKKRCQAKFGKEMYWYECPICGKFHLTSHPWDKE